MGVTWRSASWGSLFTYGKSFFLQSTYLPTVILVAEARFLILSKNASIVSKTIAIASKTTPIMSKELQL